MAGTSEHTETEVERSKLTQHAPLAEQLLSPVIVDPCKRKASSWIVRICCDAHAVATCTGQISYHASCLSRADGTTGDLCTLQEAIA
jgi:hypothetical protein